jgi:hypothetical protein
MLDYLSNSYNHLPELIKIPVWFFINIIVIRGILANEIMSELSLHGIYKRGMIERTVKKMDRWYSLARKAAIIEHYRLRAHGAGHNHESVLGCGQGRCTIF